MTDVFFRALDRARILLYIALGAGAAGLAADIISLFSSYPDFHTDSLFRTLCLLLLTLGLVLQKNEKLSLAKLLLMLSFTPALLVFVLRLLDIQSGMGAMASLTLILPAAAVVGGLALSSIPKTGAEPRLLITAVSASALAGGMLVAYRNVVLILDETAFYPGFSQTHFVLRLASAAVSEALYLLILSIFAGESRIKKTPK